MPYTPEQRRLFHAAAESKEVAREHGMPQGEAKKLADEADKLKKDGKEKAAGFIDMRHVFGRPRV